MLEHGGRIREAASRWGIPLADWLDLSTGIAPDHYPLPDLSSDCWRRLPEDGDGLEEAARNYYGSDSLLALPGSQAAIMHLPRLRPAGLVAVLTPAYGEYAAAWQAAGHRILPYAGAELECVAARADVVVLGNPNNPTGEGFARDRLLAAAHALSRHQGWLVVDEAFADADPGNSLAHLAGTSEAANLVVLRSLGKFFGLAGARVGFAIAAPGLLAQLASAIGPWAIAHPSRHVATAALRDTSWQCGQRQYLRSGGERLERLLAASGLGLSAGTALFHTIVTPRANSCYEALARCGILVRRLDDPPALRFGLPGDETQWSRLATALDNILIDE